MQASSKRSSVGMAALPELATTLNVYREAPGAETTLPELEAAAAARLRLLCAVDDAAVGRALRGPEFNGAVAEAAARHVPIDVLVGGSARTDPDRVGAWGE